MSRRGAGGGGTRVVLHPSRPPGVPESARDLADRGVIDLVDAASDDEVAAERLTGKVSVRVPLFPSFTLALPIVAVAVSSVVARSATGRSDASCDKASSRSRVTSTRIARTASASRERSFNVASSTSARPTRACSSASSPRIAATGRPPNRKPANRPIPSAASETMTATIGSTALSIWNEART